MNNQPQQVPLIQLLRRVPENAKLIVDSADGMGSTFHPVGRLCHEAAEALEQPAQEPVAWNEEEFNAIAYAYRTCPAHEVKMVSERYQDLVDYVLSFTPIASHSAQEPVAVCKDSIVNWVNGKAIDGWLYVHPAPAREPLSESALFDLYKKHAYELYDATGNALTPFGNFVEGFRSAEKAHGIGE